MRSQTNRKAIIISALVTAFALTLATGGLLLSNRLSANATAPAQKQPAATTAPLAQPATDSATLAAQRSLVFGAQHPGMTGPAPLTPDQIADVVLHGVSRKDDPCS